MLWPVTPSSTQPHLYSLLRHHFIHSPPYLDVQFYESVMLSGLSKPLHSLCSLPELFSLISFNWVTHICSVRVNSDVTSSKTSVLIPLFTLSQSLKREAPALWNSVDLTG